MRFFFIIILMIFNVQSQAFASVIDRTETSQEDKFPYKYKKFSGIKYDLSLLALKNDYRPTNLIIAINEIEKKGLKISGVRVISVDDALGMPVEIRKTMDEKFILYVRSDYVEASVGDILGELNIKTKLSQAEIEDQRIKSTRKEILVADSEGKKAKSWGEKFFEKLASVSSRVLDSIQDSKKTDIITGAGNIPARDYYKTYDEVFEKSEFERKFSEDSYPAVSNEKKVNEPENEQKIVVTDRESKEKEATEYYNEGYDLSDKGEIDQAISKYDKAITVYPEFSAAYNNRGFIYAKKGDYNKAISDYDKAIALDANFTSAYYNRGSSFSDIGQIQKAIDDYNKVLEIDPSFVNAYYNRASAYKKLGKNDIAISDYTKALQLEPNSVIGYYNRGYAYFDAEDYDRASADFYKVIQLDKNFAGAYLNLGNILSFKGDLNGAIFNYNAAINIEPNEPISHYLRAGVNANLGNFEEAISDYSKAIELDHNKGIFYHDRAIVYFRLSEYDKSLNDVEKAKNLGEVIEPELLDALNNVK